LLTKRRQVIDTRENKRGLENTNKEDKRDLRKLKLLMQGREVLQVGGRDAYVGGRRGGHHRKNGRLDSCRKGQALGSGEGGEKSDSKGGAEL